jgi:hypothetical protein
MFAIHRKAQVFGRATAAVLSAALITATYAAPIPASQRGVLKKPIVRGFPRAREKVIRASLARGDQNRSAAYSRGSSTGTRRSGRCGRVALLLRTRRSLWLRGGGLRPACARRRNCARRGPNGRLAGWTLRRWWRRLCSRKFGAFLQPRFIIRRCIDNERAFHSIMPQTAQLGADHLVSPRLDGSEPDWN